MMKLDKERSLENKSYLQRRTIQLRLWQRVLDRLISRAVKAEGKNRREQHRHIIKIQVKKDRTEVKLKQLSGASNKMWDNIKMGMEKSWKELREAFLKASAKTKNNLND
ncbi:MAG: hypothetical protein P8Y99_08405 [Calditrichaceae bacterium]|jgi:hypothetical protein